MQHPVETFECEIVDIDEESVEVSSVTSGGEEATAWLSVLDIDPWRRHIGETFRIEVYVDNATDTSIAKLIWHEPAKLPVLHRRHFRTYVYPIMWAIALGMLVGGSCGGHWSGCEVFALLAVASCLLGMYLSRPRPRPSASNSHTKVISSDD